MISNAIISVVAGIFITWIILSVLGILKEFTIKGGPLLEIKTKMNDMEKETRTSNKEISGKIDTVNQTIQNNIQNIHNRIDTVMNTVSNSNANAENKMETHYHISKEAFNKSGIPEETLDSKKDIPKEELKKIDELFYRMKGLEDSLNKPVKLTIPDLLKRANYFFYKKNHKKALDLYKTILKEDPGNYDALFNSAYSYGELEDHKKSMLLYKKVLDSYPEAYSAWQNLGVAYVLLMENKKAEECYEKVLEINPNHINARLGLSKIYRNKGELGRSLEILKEAEKIEPNNRDLLETFAHAYYWINDIETTESYANKMLTPNPKTFNEKFSNGVANLLLTNYEKSEEILEDLILENPEKSEAWYNLACAKAKLGKEKEAIKILKRALKLRKYWKQSILTDPDFKSLRTNSEFLALAES